MTSAASTPLGCRPAQSRIVWSWPGPPSGEDVGRPVVEGSAIDHSARATSRSIPGRSVVAGPAVAADRPRPADQDIVAGPAVAGVAAHAPAAGPAAVTGSTGCRR